MPTQIEGVSHVDKEELAKILKERSDVYVIDVREPDEYMSGHVPGVPLIPMNEFPEIIDQLDKNAEYVFICRSGARSFNVARYCQMHGISNVHNYLGGMLGWDKEMEFGPENMVNEFDMDSIKRVPKGEKTE